MVKLGLNRVFHTVTPGYDPQGNGLVEGMIKLLKKQARTLLAATSIPHHYWPYALAYGAKTMQVHQAGGKLSGTLPQFGSRVVALFTPPDQHARHPYAPRAFAAHYLCGDSHVSRGAWVIKNLGSESIALVPEPRLVTGTWSLTGPIQAIQHDLDQYYDQFAAPPIGQVDDDGNPEGIVLPHEQAPADPDDPDGGPGPPPPPSA